MSKGKQVTGASGEEGAAPDGQTAPKKRKWHYHGTPEEWKSMLARRAASMRAAFARMTPEKKAERARRIAEGQAAMSPERKAERYRKMAESSRKAWAGKTPEERAAFGRNVSKGQKRMSKEARAEMRRKQAEKLKANYAAMTPEEKEAWKLRHWDPSKMTEAERAAHSEAMRERAKKLWADLTPAKKKRLVAKISAKFDPAAHSARMRAKYASMTPEEREAWRKMYYSPERMEKARVKRMETMRAWSPEKKSALGRKIARSRMKNFRSLPKDVQESIIEQRHRTPERRAQRSSSTKAWLARLSDEERQAMVERINTTEAHAKAGAAKHRQLAKLTKAERREAVSQLHTPEARAKSKAGVKAWFDALPPEERARVVSVIQAKERLARKKSRGRGRSDQ